MVSEELLKILDAMMPRDLRRALQDWYKASDFDGARAIEFLSAVILGVFVTVRYTPLTLEETEVIRRKLTIEDRGEIEVIPFRPRGAVAEKAPGKTDDAEVMIGLA